MKKLLILIAMLFTCGTVQAQQPRQNNYNFYFHRPNISVNGGFYNNYNSRLQYYQRLQKKRQEYYKKLQEQRFYQQQMRRTGGVSSFIMGIRL